jgi:hypothetical protein
VKNSSYRRYKRQPTRKATFSRIPTKSISSEIERSRSSLVSSVDMEDNLSVYAGEDDLIDTVESHSTIVRKGD